MQVLAGNLHNGCSKNVRYFQENIIVGVQFYKTLGTLESSTKHFLDLIKKMRAANLKVFHFEGFCFNFVSDWFRLTKNDFP